MEIRVIQPDDNKINYFERIAGFLTGKVKNREQLDSRFDCFMTEFAMTLSSANYNAEKRTLTIT